MDLTDKLNLKDVVMPMYNLLEQSKNYIKTTGSLWTYYRDEPRNRLSSNSASFKYQTSITGNTYNGNDNADRADKNKTEIVIPLKYLSNWCRTLNIPLINCEVELVWTWSKNCVLDDMTVRAAGNNNDLPAIVTPTGLELYKNRHKIARSSCHFVKRKWQLLEQLKSGFKRTVKWNKCRSQMTIQPQNSNLGYLIDLTLTKVSRLFVSSSKRIEENNVEKDHRDSFSHYYLPKRWNKRFQCFNWWKELL